MMTGPRHLAPVLGAPGDPSPPRPAPPRGGYVIRLLSPSGPVLTRDPRRAALPAWLASYDPDGHDGYADVEVTYARGRAQRFRTFENAWQTWQARSTIRPCREDGQPNRPLTAFTVAIEPAFASTLTP